jgi:hypothetical protein
MRTDTLRYSLLKPLRDRTASACRAVTAEVGTLAALAARELAAAGSVDVSLRRRLWLWRHGFTSRSDALFDVDRTNHHEFVSDRQHERVDDVDGRWADVVTNKLAYYLLFEPLGDHLPELYGVVDDGTLQRGSPRLADPHAAVGEAPPDGAADPPTRTPAGPWARTYLDAHDALVLKPVYGSGGRGVLVCRRRGDDGTEAGAGADGAGGDAVTGTPEGYVVNGEPYTPEAFDALVGELSEYLAWSFVEQADYAAALYPDATNTLRVVTLWDDATDEPFVSGAVHRVGTAASAPVDNWSRRGLSAEIRDDGTLSSAAQWRPDEGSVEWFDEHPDTGEPLAGRSVPDWPAVREGVLAMAAEVPSLPRLGWDVVVADDGFRVLEVNAHAATRTLQVHRPLLADPRTRRFYERHGGR